MNTPTQHADAIAVAEIIRAFKARYPDSADRLLTEYAELAPSDMRTVKVEKLEERIEELEEELRDANEKIEELEMEAAE
jgi:septation ring formation regulator EzrA